MVALTNKLDLFREYGGYNVEVWSERIYGGSEEINEEHKKEPQKESPSSSVLNHSQSLFKMDMKVDIKPYQGEIDSLKLI